MIAVVVPTIRPESLAKFKQVWNSLFQLHKVDLVVVFDGDEQRLEHWNYEGTEPTLVYSTDTQGVMGEDYDLIPKYTAACRNLGFAYTAIFLRDAKYIITLDDDVEPLGDTIRQHLLALELKVPISWMNTANEMFMRGFPYSLREEAEVWVSHGVWHGVPDLDAVTQLAFGAEHEMTYYSGAVPRGVYIPFCGMNVGFRREALPYMYYAPVHLLRGAERFDDIWLGIQLTRVLDHFDKAMVTGIAQVKHQRASNVWKNLQREVVGMEINEVCWKDESHPFFRTYASMRQRWQGFINAAMKEPI